jgi:LCP family protein required for cell wall assembly
VHIHSLTAIGHDSQSRQIPAAKHTSAAPPETILLVGSDSRAALEGTASAGEYGSASETSGARSDTIILVRLVPATKQIEMLSIPRDLYVPIAGLGDQKINAALGVSPDLLINTIKAQFGVDINHYIDIDFQSFKDISDAIGGVDVYFPTPARDAEESTFMIPAAGCVSLIGNEALDFVRSRMYQYYLDGYWHQEGESDLARIERQQLFIRKMVGKAERTGLTNPITLNGIIGGVTKNLTVDDTFSVSDMLNLVETFRSVNPASIQGLTLPTYAETLPGPDDVLMPEVAQDQAMIQQFLSLGATPPSSAPAASSTTSTVAPSGTSSVPGTSSAPTTALAPSTIGVEVYNGSGVTGQAGAASSALRAAGYDVVSTGTASSYDHPTTVIEYGAGQQVAAAQLQASIGGGATLEQISGLGSDLELITGQSYTGIVAPGPQAATTTTTTAASTTTTTTVPATTTTTYALPGTPATGAPSCN